MPKFPESNKFSKNFKKKSPFGYNLDPERFKTTEGESIEKENLDKDTQRWRDMDAKLNSALPSKDSPTKTMIGRFLLGRKKHVQPDGSEVIVDRKGNIVKTKSPEGITTKYKKGSRPAYTQQTA